MANLLVVAVDPGNKNIKTPHTEPFNSGLICHGNIPPAIKADTLCYEGNYYTLTQSRVPYMYDKTSDWSYYVLTLFAIAKEFQASGMICPGQKNVRQDICLAMGLPPTHIHDLAPKYQTYFGRDGRRVEFTYNDISFEIRVARVFVFPAGRCCHRSVYGTNHGASRGIYLHHRYRWIYDRCCEVLAAVKSI